jgi:hypothetical protein
MYEFGVLRPGRQEYRRLPKGEDDMSTSRQIIQVYCLNHHLLSELAMVQADHDTPMFLV